MDFLIKSTLKIDQIDLAKFGPNVWKGNEHKTTHFYVLSHINFTHKSPPLTTKKKKKID